MGSSRSSQYIEYSNEPSPIVTPFLFLGGHWSMNNSELLDFLGVTHVLNLALELPVTQQLLYNPRIKVKQIYATDTEDYFIRNDFDTSFDFIDRAREAGGKLKNNFKYIKYLKVFKSRKNLGKLRNGDFAFSYSCDRLLDEPLWYDI